MPLTPAPRASVPSVCAWTLWRRTSPTPRRPKADGKPYQRKSVSLQATQSAGSSFDAILGNRMGSSTSNGVEVAGIVADPSPGKKVYDPGHPDADANGYITLPNVNPVTEMVDLITAQRGYEANVTAMQTAKTMFNRTLDLLR